MACSFRKFRSTLGIVCAHVPVHNCVYAAAVTSEFICNMFDLKQSCVCKFFAVLSLNYLSQSVFSSDIICSSVTEME